jgi:sugar lactone lactonase YvrE
MRTVDPGHFLSVRHTTMLAGLAAAAAIAACDSATVPVEPISSSLVTTQATATVFATGLQYPRGLTFGPDGTLYVAEAGAAGSNSTTPAQCAQVIPPTGPYVNGPTGRISRIDRQGHRTTFADGFPSGMNAFGDILGVNDVAFIGNHLYALIAGGGCSHGSADVPASIARVERTGSWTLAADLSAWQAANPVAHPNPGDFEPDGSWYGMISVGATLFAVEPNHGEIVKVRPHTGLVSRLADISATQGHAVPTVVAERHGAFYVSSLGTFPVTPGSQDILRVSRTGQVSVVAGGFTAVLGLDFDRHGRLYVLETTHGAGFPTPGTGRVVRLDRQGHRDIIVDGLFLPTGLRVGPDGALYIANKGFGPPQPGEILRVDLPRSNDTHADDGDMEPATASVAATSTDGRM